MLDQDEHNEARIRAGRARMALCEALPAAMTEVTGDEWIPIPYNAPARHRVGGTPHRITFSDPNEIPGRFVGCTLCRTRDGFEIDVYGKVYDENLFRMKANASFPRDPATPKWHAYIWQIPGYYHNPHPKTEFDATRPPKAIAKQIARTILTPTTEAAFNARLDELEKRIKNRNAKAAWLAVLAEIVGTKVDDDDLRRPAWMAHPQGFCLRDGMPGGTVTISLPEDIEEMREVMETLLPIMRKMGD